MSRDTFDAVPTANESLTATAGESGPLNLTDGHYATVPEIFAAFWLIAAAMTLPATQGPDRWPWESNR